VHEGDRQAPEGFYTITPELMNPNSNFYVAINTGATAQLSHDLWNLAEKGHPEISQP
jgi:hypothetical protein